MKIKNDLIYDEIHALKADLYQPDNASKGLIIDIHGGGWFRGNKAKDQDLAEALVRDGFSVIVPNYRLTPDAYYPAPLDDMDTLYHWIKTSSKLFDSDRIAVVGSSAGGNMAVEMGIKYELPIVSLSGILDIDDWLNEHTAVIAQPDHKQDFTNSKSSEINQTGQNDAFYKWFVTNYFNGNSDQYSLATPYKHVNSQPGPMFLANSLNEFVPTSGVLEMAKILTSKNVPFVEWMLPGTQHAKGYLEIVYPTVLNFLNQYI